MILFSQPSHLRGVLLFERPWNWVSLRHFQAVQAWDLKAGLWCQPKLGLCEVISNVTLAFEEQPL